MVIPGGGLIFDLTVNAIETWIDAKNGKEISKQGFIVDTLATLIFGAVSSSWSSTSLSQSVVDDGIKAMNKLFKRVNLRNLWKKIKKFFNLKLIKSIWKEFRDSLCESIAMEGAEKGTSWYLDNLITYYGECLS